MTHLKEGDIVVFNGNNNPLKRVYLYVDDAEGRFNQTKAGVFQLSGELLYYYLLSKQDLEVVGHVSPIKFTRGSPKVWIPDERRQELEQWFAFRNERE